MAEDADAAAAAQFLASLNLMEKTDVGLREYRGKVIMLLPEPKQAVIFDPQQAFTIAEHLARAAHQARFPEQKISNDFSYLAQQVKQRLTDDMRDRLQIRIATMLPSLLERKDLTYISKQLIDTIFAHLDNESFAALTPRGMIGKMVN